MGDLNISSAGPLSVKKIEGQTARWIQLLQEYNFTSERR
jgi:hypothetical protein